MSAISPSDPTTALRHRHASASDLGPTVGRRIRSVPAVLVGFVVVAPLLIVALPVIALFDLVRGKPSLPRARFAVFAIWYLAWEVAAVGASAALWVATGFGRAVDRPWSKRAHSRLQARWVSSILGVAQSVLGLRLEVDGAEHLADGPLIVLCRHASMVDTLVPAKILFDHGLGVRYVLKEELLWDPALDIIGHRLPNYFIDRSSPDMAAEIDGIQALAAGAGPDEAVVLFPEGTRWSPSKRRRAIEHLRENDATLARRAEHLEWTMPPRPGGTLALLAGLPAADVVIVRHTGLEGLAGPKEALRLLPLRRPVQVSITRIARADVPRDPQAQRAWLLDRWDEVDAWVRTHREA